MKGFKEYLNEVRILNARSTLDRHGAVTEKVDGKNIEIRVEHTKPMTMKDGSVLDVPADDSWIRVRKFTSSDPFELTSIQVGTENRGSAMIALALIKRARELANEPIVLSDVRSPDGKRLAQAARRLGWTETRDGQEWVK